MVVDCIGISHRKCSTENRKLLQKSNLNRGSVTDQMAVQNALSKEQKLESIGLPNLVLSSSPYFDFSELNRITIISVTIGGIKKKLL